MLVLTRQIWCERDSEFVVIRLAVTIPDGVSDELASARAGLYVELVQRPNVASPQPLKRSRAHGSAQLLKRRIANALLSYPNITTLWNEPCSKWSLRFARGCLSTHLRWQSQACAGVSLSTLAIVIVSIHFSRGAWAHG